MQRYSHNAVSKNSPSHFQGVYSQIFNDKLMICRKKPVVLDVCSNELYTPRINCRSLPPMSYDQDMDSIRFSDQAAVEKGLKNSVRFESNFFKNFYNNAEHLFNRPEKQITFMQPVKKVTRTYENPTQSLRVQKSIKHLMNSEVRYREFKDIDPGNRLLHDFKQDDSECKSPVSTGVKFYKKSLPNLAKISGKMNCIMISQEIREFEKKIPKQEKNKGNLWYKNLIKS